MLVHLIAESIVKARGPLRQVYDDRRYATADRDWTPMHKHNDALRLLGKAFLKDLWLAACGANAGEGGQRWIETHPVTAPLAPVSYTHLRAHETDSYLVCRLLLEKKKNERYQSVECQ